MIKAAFFDFNGTLYFDQDINKATWKETINNLSNNQIDFEKFFVKYRSVMDYIVIQDAFKLINHNYTQEEVQYWVNYKEDRYRQYGLDHKRTVLPPGAIDVLNYLKSKNIPMILCTSSIIENVEYYYKYFNLSNWFNFNQTVYDTGEYNGKLEMYLECAKRLNVNIKDAIVFEDSAVPIKECISAGCQKVVAIKRQDTPNLSEIKLVIEDYLNFDYTVFD